MAYNKNVAGQFCYFQGVDATTGGIKSGVTWTIRRYIDGTAAAGGGTVTEDGTAGWYKYAMTQADTNGTDLAFNFTGTGAVPQTVNCTTDGGSPNVTFVNTSIATVTTLTNLPAITANWLTAAGIAASALNGKGDWLLSSSYTAPLSAAATATAVWTDTTAGDFTTALSVGKSVMNGVALGTGLTINAYTGNTVQTGDSFARIGATGSGLTSLAASATALSTTQWTNARAAFLDNINNAALATTASQSGDTYARLGAPVGASISADIAGVPAATWATTITGTTTAIQATRGFIAAMLGKSSGLDVGTPTFRNIADSKNVIAATADANGNRATVTLDLT